MALLDELEHGCGPLCEPPELLPAYLPGVALTLAFAFLLIGRVPRSAVVVAGMLGTIRFVVPFALVAASTGQIRTDDHVMWVVGTSFPFPMSIAGPASLSLYLATIVAFFVYAIYVRGED